MIDPGRLFAFWWGFLPAAVLAYPIYKTLLRLKARQTVSGFAPEGHQLKQGTPTMGGLILVAALAVACVIGLMSPSGLQGSSWWPSALVLLLGFGAIGFVDDFVVPRLMAGKRGLGWKQKLIGQVLVAVAASAMLFGTFDVRVAITAFTILFYANAYNFADGLDALAGTLLIGLAMGIGGISLARGADVTTVPLMLAMIGAVVPFLFLNAPPAKIFMGDVGSLPIGALLGAACCVIVFQDVRPGMASIWGMEIGSVVAVKLVSVVMFCELVPVPLQVLWVKKFKKKLFPYTPIHHAFEKAGWPETRVTAMFSLVQLVLSALAVTVAATL